MTPRDPDWNSLTGTCRHLPGAFSALPSFGVGHMNGEEVPTRNWFWTALTVGGTYAGVGILFGAFASASNAMQIFWRVAAWVVSAVIFGAHIWHENVRMKKSPAVSALHASTAAALGAFGLAVAANLHELFTTHVHRLLLLLALVLWPVLTGIPAFVAAFLVALGLARLRRKATDVSQNG